MPVCGTLRIELHDRTCRWHEFPGISRAAAGRARWFAARAAALLQLLSAAGCSDGVLDPHGPIASDERIILFNSLGIMLAIVIPTILATLAVAFWFRASNTRARYMPDFHYSGRVEMMVWSVPAMTVFLLGSLCWVSSHDLDPPKPIASSAKPLTVQVVSLDWKWLFIYPEQGIAAVNTLTIPVATPINFRTDIVRRDEQLHRAAACRPDLHHGSDDDPPANAGE